MVFGTIFTDFSKAHSVADPKVISAHEHLISQYASRAAGTSDSIPSLAPAAVAFHF